MGTSRQDSPTGETPSSSGAESLFVGIDVGGTNIKVGIVDGQGRVVDNCSLSTQPEHHPSVSFQQTKEQIDQLLSNNNRIWKQVAAVGLGTPGPMDLKAGCLLNPSNLPGWHNINVRNLLAEIVQRPVTLANDAGAAAYGEYWVGSGHLYDSLVLLTLGTGVGGGIIINGFSLDGQHSHGAELGHLTIDSSSSARLCGCGQLGHLEAYASASAFVERTLERLASTEQAEKKSVLHQRQSDGKPITAREIAIAAEDGDTLSLEIIAETAGYLGRGIADLAHVLDPAVFILGGGMDFGGANSSLGQMFLKQTLAATQKLVFPVLANNLKLKFATLGGDAGFIGAAGLAERDFAAGNR